MAKQEGIIELTGTIGKITFQRTKNGFTASRKSSLSGKRLATDPNFARTRENNSEFGKSGKAGKLIKTANRLLLIRNGGQSLNNNLMSLMMKIIKTDTINARGERNFNNADTTLLKGFNLTETANLSNTLGVAITTAVDRNNGKAIVNIPAFTPQMAIVAPPESTHYSIALVASELDFVNNKQQADLKQTPIAPINNVVNTGFTISATIPSNSLHTIMMVVSVQFYQDINGISYPLNNGVFNPVSIVEVEKV